MIEASVAVPYEELRSPLLGVNPNEAIDEEQQVHHIKVFLRDGDHDDGDNAETDQENGDAHLLFSDEVMIFFFLPCLMFSQFGMAFLMHDESTKHLSWSIVNFSIFLYWVTAWLYQHACQDSKIETLLVVLLPEILMDVILVIVCLDKVPLGLFVLLVSVIGLSTFAFMVTARLLADDMGNDDDDDDNAVPKQQLQEIQIY
jgi:hypothetical protein